MPPRRKRQRWLRHEGIDLGDVVVQIFAVVVGILLALLINDWVTQRQQQANVDEALRAIKVELMANRIGLRAHARQLFDMAKAMQDAPGNQNQPPRFCFQWNQWRGIGGLNLTDAAYQTSIATQALANMPFQQAQLVAQVYGWQHYFQKGDELSVNLLTQHPESLDFCVGIVKDAASQNLQLAEFYSKLIGSDDDAPPKPSARQTPSRVSPTTPRNLR